MKLPKFKELTDLKVSKRVHNWLNKNYLVVLTAAGLKSISETRMHSELLDIGPFTHKGCLFVPFVGGDFWVINQEHITKNLAQKDFYSSHVTSFEDVYEFLTKRDKFCSRKKMTEYDYFMLMGKLFGYPEINCKLFAKEISRRELSSLRKDRVPITSLIRGTPQEELTIISYRNDEESVRASSELIYAWDKYYTEHLKK